MNEFIDLPLLEMCRREVESNASWLERLVCRFFGHDHPFGLSERICWRCGAKTPKEPNNG